MHNEVVCTSAKCRERLEKELDYDDGVLRGGEERPWREVWHGVEKWTGFSTAAEGEKEVTA